MTRVPELRALTGMRGIAAWFVVFYHIRGSIAGLPPLALAILGKGYLAVDFFFLLSGFVIWLAWHDRIGEQGTLAFWHKRIARIWPLHLVLLACAVLLALILAATGRADTTAFPLDQLPLQVLLIQDWGLTDHLAWNDPAWSISAECAAYLLFPLLVASIDWRRCATVVLLIAADAFLVTLHLVMHEAPGLGFDISRFGVVRCLCEFATGTIVAALWQRHTRWSLIGASATLVTLVAARLAGAPETLVVPAAFAAALLALALTTGRRGNPLEGCLIHYLGEISYATYLGHFLLWRVFKLAFVTDPGAVAPTLIALYLLLVLASSAGLYHWMERPAQRWIDRLGRPRRSPNTPGERLA